MPSSETSVSDSVFAATTTEKDPATETPGMQSRPTEYFAIEQVDATVGKSGDSTLRRPCQSHQETPVSGAGADGGALHSIPTKGDGRCFFRAISIALTPDLQSCQRNPLTGDILDQLKSL